jgi:hypothetical protein
VISKSIIRASGEVPLPAYLFPLTGRKNFSGGILQMKMCTKVKDFSHNLTIALNDMPNNGYEPLGLIILLPVWWCL